MQPKNIKPRTRAVRQAGMRCMSCGSIARVVHTDERQDPPLRTTWCDFCAPDVWQIVARARRIASQRWGAASPYGD